MLTRFCNVITPSLVSVGLGIIDSLSNNESLSNRQDIPTFGFKRHIVDISSKIVFEFGTADNINIA